MLKYKYTTNITNIYVPSVDRVGLIKPKLVQGAVNKTFEISETLLKQKHGEGYKKLSTSSSVCFIKTK